MQKRKIITVVLLVAVVFIAFISYEFFVADSLSGYTKVAITPSQEYSVKFGNIVDYICFMLNAFPEPNPNGNFTFSISQDSWLQVYTDNSTSQVFEPIQGAKYSFAGLQIVVGNVNESKLILYIKPSSTTSEAITSSVYSPTPDVTVSGIAHFCQNGTITFNWLNYQTTFISDGKYTITLVGGHLYNVTISYQGTHGAEFQLSTVYVPADVTYFSANF